MPLENARDHSEAESLAHRLAAAIRAPCTLAGHRHRIGASVGLVLVSRDRGPDAAEVLQREAGVAMYHTLDLTVIAEGVETPDQALLHRLGCDLIQGHHPARPRTYLERNSSRAASWVGSDGM
ncbi:EAL domain-containing protein [Pseudofrankia sp. BMG5.37]|uniref:EAL domain-containing protein n=1 Tax=Pseudofrankia sp. BMG5.37 TaxID=3050035 RepID=UPI002893EDDA|nr:EAL domain-containing protein [Pseudofrankia sp. BMG5.37]MDT3443855.1 hypothetical protein [Pseudofrankia sp. BMG5.37]